jgi:hypothetical protein
MSVQALVLATDLLMLFTVLSIWWTVRRARHEGPSGVMIAAALALALAWGAIWSFYPALSALRFLPPPDGQAGAILCLIVGLNLLRIFPSVRTMFRSIDIQRLVDLGIWRVIYGTALLVIGLQGGLPPEFFWSAAFGDILVGLWAMTIMARRPAISRREVTLWNVLGLLDLVHVLALGATYLPQFYTSQPNIAPLNLLPLVGVPLLLVLHILTLAGQFRKNMYSLSRLTPEGRG